MHDLSFNFPSSEIRVIIVSAQPEAGYLYAGALCYLFSFRVLQVSSLCKQTSKPQKLEGNSSLS